MLTARLYGLSRQIAHEKGTLVLPSAMKNRPWIVCLEDCSKSKFPMN